MAARFCNCDKGGVQTLVDQKLHAGTRAFAEGRGSPFNLARFDDFTFKLNGKDYTLAFAGFQVNGDTVSQFITQEGASNTAQLIGRFSVAEVPLPAAGWLLVSALGGLGVMSRRRRHDTDASAA